MDEPDIVIRSGTLSAEPVMETLGLPEGAVQVSVSFYNTREEVDQFIQVLEQFLRAKRAAV